MNRRPFARFAWFFVAYLVAVILFGAWVRITGSGNGCGSHWPACNGALVPPAPAEKTLIEYTHRLMSGLSVLFALTLVVWARRLGRSVFQAALLALFFLIVEAGLGALLVLAHLVVNDASVARALVVALHLANTLLLTASAALVAWRAATVSDASSPQRAAPVPASRPLLGLALAALMLTCMSGAVTALGDTVFPPQPVLYSSTLAAVQAGVSPGQHFLVRLRVLHPLVAVCAALLVAGVLLRIVTGRAPAAPAQANLATLAFSAVVLQTGVGFVNVLLAAPGWLQIVHLAMAQAVWLSTWLVWLAARRP
ncbi:MAG: COX15/CtaA family protein [Bryobacteraceae bacterium]|jgi:heme A synthase